MRIQFQSANPDADPLLVNKSRSGSSFSQQIQIRILNIAGLGRPGRKPDKPDKNSDAWLFLVPNLIIFMKFLPNEFLF